MSWIWTSIALSVVLTLVLNLAVRARSRRPRPSSLDSLTRRADKRPSTRTRVFFPWKAMLAVSIVATIVINVIAR